MAKLVWPHIVNFSGGVHEFGRLLIVIHDTGLTIAWKQLVKFDWKI